MEVEIGIGIGIGEAEGGVWRSFGQRLVWGRGRSGPGMWIPDIVACGVVSLCVKEMGRRSRRGRECLGHESQYTRV